MIFFLEIFPTLQLLALPQFKIVVFCFVHYDLEKKLPIQNLYCAKNTDTHFFLMEELAYTYTLSIPEISVVRKVKVELSLIKYEFLTYLSTSAENFLFIDK